MFFKGDGSKSKRAIKSEEFLQLLEERKVHSKRELDSFKRKQDFRDSLLKDELKMIEIGRSLKETQSNLKQHQ
ncbi:hypothetical protein K8O68_07715 [Salipaludibacillus sp. CUR1]|uniref:hypothetical protein n=1 Tax=Salipaludibacillus sp. CUR1 TaxID=2820003 RepID=UPI001E3782D9|nr:hypothetical protein [Salipaludibacillus sp. CUR1]MCE7792306.1 hypothetical protein [Salipaludibacillus sp. CUR1]